MTPDHGQQSMLTAAIPPDLMERLTTAAASAGMTRSAAVREALVAWVSTAEAKL